MKKILLSAAAFAVVAVSAVSVAPTTSEAIPAFARQTGAACLSCHFQSFPTLAPFGREFKKGAFTDVGEQALVEDDNLSMPSVLNITMMFRPQFNTSTSAAGVKTNSIAATADQVLMFGGRIGANTGAFVEYDGTFANQQLLHSVDMGDFKVIGSYYNAGFGEDSGLQLMSVWGQHGGMLGGKALTINNTMGAAANTVGVSLSVANDMGAVTFGLVDPGSATQAASWRLAPMVRAQGIFDVDGMELAVGAIVVSGDVGVKTAALTEVAKRFGIDAQLQGEFGETQVGVYVDYASASAGTAAKPNIYNPSVLSSRTGYSARVTVKPVHNIVGMIGLGQDKTGALKTDKFAVGVEYEVYQNAVINLTYDTSKTAAGTVKNTGLDFEFLM